MTSEIIRPGSLDSFVGQSDIVRDIKIALASAKARNDAFPHMLMSGQPGLGKTTLAEIVAREMGYEFFSVLGAAIRDEQGLRNLLSQLPTDGYNLQTGKIENPELVRYPIIFIDEIHRLKKNLTELLHTALEDFKISMRMTNPLTGKTQTGMYWMPRFTLIGATNYLGALPRPFADRFMIQSTFDPYTQDELLSIANFSTANLGIKVDEAALIKIVEKSRGVPRILNRFLLRARDVAIYADYQEISEPSVREMFEIQNIDELGLTKLDRKVLDYLGNIIRPVGIGSIAQAVGEDQQTIENIVEPWLVQLRLMTRTSQGRQITELGLKHIGATSNSRVIFQ